MIDDFLNLMYPNFWKKVINQTIDIALVFSTG